MKFGAHTHFAQFHDQRLIPLLANAGIVHIRDEQYWAAVENPKGVFNYPAKFTDYMAKAKASGIEPFICLSFANQFYDYSAGQYTAPHTDAGRAGFANYALNVLNKYAGQIKAVEVWNEYNAGTFIKGPAATNKPFYYKLMLQKVYETIKPKWPNVAVVAGATVPAAHGFLRDLFAQGALPFCDAISVHYPNFVELEIAGVRDLIKAANNGIEKPIWVTEFSFGPKNEEGRLFAATFAAQHVALMLSQRVERMYYYLAMDDGNFPFRGLFGTPATNFKEHPALLAYRTAIRQYKGAIFHAKWITSPSVYAFRFRRPGRLLNVLWSVRPVTVQLHTTETLQVTDHTGLSVSQITPVNGKATIQLTNNVQYLAGAVSRIVEVNNDLLADSVSGYGKTVGINGWSYGYASVPGQYSTGLFKPMVWATWGSDNYRWIRPGASYPFAEGAHMHPDSNWAIRRWASNYAGAVKLEGEVERFANGDGVGIKIFVDGAEIYSKSVLPSTALTYSVPATLKAGSLVDFTLNQLAGSAYDATKFTSQIIKA